MSRIAAVMLGFGGLTYLLFFRTRRADAVFSAGRWMVLTWGLVALMALTTPLALDQLSTSSFAVGYALLWVGAFLFGDRLGRIRAPTGRDAVVANDRAARASTTLLLVSVIAAAAFAYQMLSTVSSMDPGTILAELRQSLVDGEQSGVRTLLQFGAFAGLPASLILVARSIGDGSAVPLYAWVGVLSSVSIYFFTAGRQGIAIASVAMCVTMAGSLRLRASRYPNRRSIIAPASVLLLMFGAYFVFNVSTRGTAGGTMDDKLAMIDRVYGIYIDPEFRDSVRPLGPVGDAASELYIYLGTQLPGLSVSLQHYEGDHDFGLNLVPYLTRRVEFLLGISVLEPALAAQNEPFRRLGIPGNFFLTAAQSTFQSFGRWLSLVAMCGVGYLSGRHRRRAVLRPSAAAIAMQGMICSGAAFTIIYSPTQEPGWAFPVMWLFLLRYMPARATRTSLAAAPPLVRGKRS